ncbi:MAG: flagellar basal body rod protein FlgB [Peptococcaceae bacterium]
MKDILANPVTDILQKSLDAASLRQRAISNNISNINTPNYKRQLVSFEEELSNYLENPSGKIPLKITNPKHLNFVRQNYADIDPRLESDNAILRTDGNNVDIDLELAVLAENIVKFNTLSQTIAKKFSMLSSVIRGGK